MILVFRFIASVPFHMWVSLTYRSFYPSCVVRRISILYTVVRAFAVCHVPLHIICVFSVSYMALLSRVCMTRAVSLYMYNACLPSRAIIWLSNVMSLVWLTSAVCLCWPLISTFIYNTTHSFIHSCVVRLIVVLTLFNILISCTYFPMFGISYVSNEGIVVYILYILFECDLIGFIPWHFCHLPKVFLIFFRWHKFHVHCAATVTLYPDDFRYILMFGECHMSDVVIISTVYTVHVPLVKFNSYLYYTFF